MLWDYEAWYHSRVFIDSLQVALKEVMMIHGTLQIGTKEKNQLMIGQGKSYNEVIFPKKKSYNTWCKNCKERIFIQDNVLDTNVVNNSK